MAAVDDILGRVKRLPSLPATATRLVALITGGECSAAEIEQIVRQDEAIAMTVLRRANSSAFGTPGKVFELNESIVRLGTRTLLRIALERSVSGVFDGAGGPHGLRRGDLWRLAMGGAIAAEQLAADHAPTVGSLAFLCGLLRDVGKLAVEGAVGAALPSHVSGFDENREYTDSEHDLLGADHAELGCELALRWNLPERLALAIRHHHAPPPPGEPNHDVLFDLVHAADMVSLWAGVAVGDDGLRYRLADHVRERFAIDRREIERRVTDMWMQLGEIFDDAGDELKERSA